MWRNKTHLKKLGNCCYRNQIRLFLFPVRRHFRILNMAVINYGRYLFAVDSQKTDEIKWRNCSVHTSLYLRLDCNREKYVVPCDWKDNEMAVYNLQQPIKLIAKPFRVVHKDVAHDFSIQHFIANQDPFALKCIWRLIFFSSSERIFDIPLAKSWNTTFFSQTSDRSYLITYAVRIVN